MSEELKISLAAARVNAGFSQAEVAKIMKINKATLGNWERGKTDPSFSDFMALSALYKIPANNLFVPVKLTES